MMKLFTTLLFAGAFASGSRFNSGEDYIDSVLFTAVAQLALVKLSKFRRTLEYQRLVADVEAEFEFSISREARVERHVLEVFLSFASEPCMWHAMPAALQEAYDQVVVDNFELAGNFDSDEAIAGVEVIGEFNLEAGNTRIEGLDRHGGRYWRIGDRKYVDLYRGCGVEISDQFMLLPSKRAAVFTQGDSGSISVFVGDAQGAIPIVIDGEKLRVVGLTEDSDYFIAVTVEAGNYESRESPLANQVGQHYVVTLKREVEVLKMQDWTNMVPIDVDFMASIPRGISIGVIGEHALVAVSETKCLWLCNDQ